jgi:antitoxin component HigA of HigAB toxin-antitoxin module
MGFIENLLKTKEGRKAFERERVLFEAAEVIAKAMEKRGVNKTQLASILGTRKSYITQLLNGAENMTLAKVSDVLFELDQRFSIQSQSLGEPQNQHVETFESGWKESRRANFQWGRQPVVVGENCLAA